VHIQSQKNDINCDLVKIEFSAQEEYERIVDLLTSATQYFKEECRGNEEYIKYENELMQRIEETKREENGLIVCELFSSELICLFNVLVDMVLLVDRQKEKLCGKDDEISLLEKEIDKYETVMGQLNKALSLHRFIIWQQHNGRELDDECVRTFCQEFVEDGEKT
jgi:hypothetical protein